MKLLQEIEGLLVIALLGVIAYFIWKLFFQGDRPQKATDLTGWLLNFVESLPGVNSPDPWVLGSGPVVGGHGVPIGGGGGDAF
jgi:hypothetical protein